MSLFLPITIFIISSLTGISLILWLSVFREKTLIVAIGTVVGLTITTVIIYLSSAFFLLSPSLIYSILLVEVVYLGIASVRGRAWSTFYMLPANKPATIVLVVLLVLSALITPKLLFTSSATNGGLSTSIINAYGDLGFHLANITNLAFNATIPPANPILAGNNLTYPFFSNFFSAILLVAGANYSQAVVWPAFLLIPLTLFLFYQLTFTFTGSSKVALIALLLFALGGSTFGWVRVVNDLQMPHESFLQLLANLPINYTGHSDDPLSFYIINPIISLLLPQRSFMFGMSLAFIILLLLTRPPSHPAHHRVMIIAGLLSGLLPLFHAHTVIALVPIIIMLFLYQPKQGWLSFFVTAALIGLPGLLYFSTSHASAAASPHLQLGWMAHNQSIILFWLKNSGLLIPITLLGFFLPVPKPTKVLALAGLLLFLSANVWRFAAWEWDNTKIFVYWILFTLPLIASAGIILWQRSKYYWRAILFAVLVFHLLSGSIDVFRLTLPNLPAWPEWDPDAIAMAESIRAKTKRGDVILIAPYHNSPVALSGRSAYLGFPGHVWTHGSDHTQREGSIGRFYTGQLATLAQIQPQYVVVGPVERSFFPELQIRPEWQLIAHHGNYELYKI